MIIPIILKGISGQYAKSLVFLPMAISLVVPLIVFFALQRYFVRGLMAGSVKG